MILIILIFLQDATWWLRLYKLWYSITKN